LVKSLKVTVEGVQTCGSAIAEASTAKKVKVITQVDRLLRPGVEHHTGHALAEYGQRLPWV